MNDKQQVSNSANMYRRFIALSLKWFESVTGWLTAKTWSVGRRLQRRVFFPPGIVTDATRLAFVHLALRLQSPQRQEGVHKSGTNSKPLINWVFGEAIASYVLKNHNCLPRAKTSMKLG